MNRLPTASAEFPQFWVDECREEMTGKVAARCLRFSKILLAVELVLLVSDFIRTRYFGVAGVEALLPWRLAFIAFLGLYAAFARQIPSAYVRAVTFLALGTAFTVWVTGTLLPGLSGDMSVFVIGMFTIAALCPLPGRFCFALYSVAALALIAMLMALHDPRVSFWLSSIVAAWVMAVIVSRTCFRALLAEFTQRKGLERQKERVNELLYNVFPQTIAASLQEGKRSIASHSEVTILFADVVGFTQLAGRLLPSQLVEILETLFGRFDSAAARHGVEKIKTIGDSYMAISGAPVAIDHSVERIAAFALEIVAICNGLGKECGFNLALRVGIHTGPVVAGVIGSSRLCYDLWGDSVNLAQRLEASSEQNVIHVSEPVYHRLRAAFDLQDRGVLDLKDIGPTRTFILRGSRDDAPHPGA